MKTPQERQSEFIAELSALCLKFGGAKIEAVVDDGYFNIPAIELFLPTQYDGKDNVTADVRVPIDEYSATAQVTVKIDNDGIWIKQEDDCVLISPRQWDALQRGVKLLQAQEEQK